MQIANRTDFLSENINLGILEDAVTKLVSEWCEKKKSVFSETFKARNIGNLKF